MSKPVDEMGKCSLYVMYSTGSDFTTPPDSFTIPTTVALMTSEQVETLRQMTAKHMLHCGAMNKVKQRAAEKKASNP